MGIFELLGGWEYVGKGINLENINPKIIRLLRKKSDIILKKKSEYYVYKHGKKKKVLHSSIGSYKFHIKGKKFIYRAKQSSQNWSYNNGHGGYFGGGMKIWKKLIR